MSISREKNGDRYKVQITLQRRTFYMGYYSTYEEAVAANVSGLVAVGVYSTTVQLPTKAD